MSPHEKNDIAMRWVERRPIAVTWMVSTEPALSTTVESLRHAGHYAAPHLHVTLIAKGHAAYVLSQLNVDGLSVQNVSAEWE